ncbi:MAG: hypothetical protein JTT11_01015 [Candidatus Brockarchaeota archaeon]|nr:hypothetical protein [Candidatus Brockarchaeota archaeon]
MEKAKTGEPCWVARFDLGKVTNNKGGEEKNPLWLTLVVLVPLLMLMYALPILAGMLPMPGARRTVPSTNPHLFFFAFLFLPFFIAVVLCVILASKTLRESLRWRHGAAQEPCCKTVQRQLTAIMP